jgi:hypothetical protein
MLSIRALTVPSMILAAVVGASSASAAGPQPAPTVLSQKPTFSLIRAKPPQDPTVVLEQSSGQSPYKLRKDEAKNASITLWHLSVLCPTRLKSLSIKSPDGSVTSFQSALKPNTKSFQKDVKLAPIPASLIEQRCLDVANGSKKSAFDAADAEELGKEFMKFGQDPQAGTPTALDGNQRGLFLLLSATCTDASGTQTTAGVTDEKHSTVLNVICQFQ